MIDIFFKSRPVSIEGRTVPECWTQTVEEVVTVLPEWGGFHCPPSIGTALDGDTIFHLMGTTQQADLLEAAGVLLGRDYYGFQALHPDLASRCAEAEYELNGEPGRCKVCDLPPGASVNAVRAPSKYLGVESPTVPDPPEEKLFPTLILEVSQADIGIMQMKEAVKIPAITWIKQNPTGTAYDLIAAIAAQYDEPHAGAGQALLAVYIQNSLRAGLIQEGTWEAFRDFIVATPVEQLEAF
jgi:hypothetical protein